MAEQLSETVIPAPPARLEPDAIGVAQDTIIGMATSAPAAVVAITLASLAAAGTGAYYGGGVSLLICAVPMVIIAYAYHRLNMWNANSGASFEWVGRAINTSMVSAPGSSSVFRKALAPYTFSVSAPSMRPTL